MESLQHRSVRPILDMPEDIDVKTYSSLMGLLATSGASLQLGYQWHWDFETVYLRLSHTNWDFLDWMSTFFQALGLKFDGQLYHELTLSNSIQIGCKPSKLCYILWGHWNQYGIHVLPVHFPQYFSIHTLAFWAMRNRQWNGNTFLIQVSMLNNGEKELLMSLIKEKLQYESRLTMKGNKLAISNPAKLVEELRPLFHESQLHRLTKKVR
jgi:hypothetical protein